MAVDCLVELLDPGTVVTTIEPNTTYAGNIPDQFSADYFKFEMFSNETVTFEIRIFTNTTDPIEVELNLYRVDGASLINVGNSFLTQFYNLFNYDGAPGEYKFCLKSRYDVDYEIQVQYTDFPFTFIPEIDFYSGATCEFEFGQIAIGCDSPVFYTLVDGELPPGLSLNPSGWIDGVPEELDCSMPQDWPPSFTLSEQANPDLFGNVMVAVTFDWTFTIRAALVDSPATFSDREFQICVANNWSFDRDAFLNAFNEGFETQRFTNVEIVGEPFDRTQTTETELCPPCLPTPEGPRELTDIEIAALCEACEIAPEYAGLVAINNNECEILCPDEPETTQAEPLLRPIPATDCAVCVQETPVEGLQMITEPVCCPVEETAETEPQAPLYELPPHYCGQDLWERMHTERVCDGPITCPYIPIEYPDPPEETGTTIPDTGCNQECE